MRGRLILGVFAAGILALTVGAIAEQAAVWTDSPSAYPKYHETAGDVQKRAPTLSLQQQLKASEDQQPCNDSQGQDASDLCAQWRSAQAAERASRWAWYQLILSAFGVLGIGATIWFNFQAWDQARRAEKDTETALGHAKTSAQAAADQVQIAQNTAYLQLRAYLSASARIGIVGNSTVSGQLIIKNAGQTPASIEVFSATWIGPAVGDRRPEMPNPRRDPQISPFVNARSYERLDWFHPFAGVGTNQEVIEWIANPTALQLHLYGRIEFTDFQKKKKRILHFGFRNSAPPKVGKSGPMVTLPWGNGYEEREL